MMLSAAVPPRSPGKLMSVTSLEAFESNDSSQ
jgi:hypothetical protein